jgi:hypothetical protein
LSGEDAGNRATSYRFQGGSISFTSHITIITTYSCRV